jgi:hypothetical protein
MVLVRVGDQWIKLLGFRNEETDEWFWHADCLTLHFWSSN